MLGELIKVKGQPDLRRDSKSSGIVNTDNKGYEEFKARRKEFESLKARCKTNEDKICVLESMLLKLMEKQTENVSI